MSGIVVVMEITYSSIRECLGSGIHRTHDSTVATSTSHEFTRDKEAERERRYGESAGRQPGIEDESYTGIACEE